jgi:predicted esterase
MRAAPLRVVAGLALLAPFAAAAAPDLPRGQVLPRVVCETDPRYSFALYLPSGYTPERRWPAILAFSPAGRGEDPVRLLALAAERYGYVVLGSNDSKNGPFEPVKRAQEVLWEEAKRRFSLEPGRAYAAGFSGGARAAVYLVLAHPEEFAGAIACGSFQPERAKVPKKCPQAFYMLVGSEDFNLFEFTRARRELEKKGATFWLEEFDGPHRWPGEEKMTAAVQWLQAAAMKRGLLPRDPAFFEGQAGAALAEAEALAKQGALLRALAAYEQTASLYSGVPAAETAAARGEALARRPEVKEALRRQERFEVYHERLAASGSPGELISLLRQLQSMEKAGGPDAHAASLLIRLAALSLGQLGTNLLLQKDYSNAVAALDLASGLQPEDGLLAYNAACAKARVGDKKGALDLLERAVGSGFNRPSFMASDPDLASLAQEPRFKALVAGVPPPEKK